MTGVSKEESVSLDLLRQKMRDFAKERSWEPYHTPRNLLLALVGEMGELSEIFQWKGEVERGLPNWKEEEKVHLGEELSDVLLYLIQLSDSCGIDLGQVALRKLQLNAVGEMGELSEIFQWKGEVERGLPNWKEEEKVHLGEELSDVLLYLIQLSDSCDIDLGQVALRKLQLNAVKYPVNK
ncbi:dCTP pyrophosphatase 1-like isoform X1 [Chenopodium quinoa]|uniref:dCTP pyrophosphatase 1-like isoform X1 n=1 Tax=Chenopodium quinoa TaxID=63459 RepID=UPI000B796871|nr:dCTP pyrophosphatase 1-like isoform X1 [Chenopodium quinoa]